LQTCSTYEFVYDHAFWGISYTTFS
jgi:hypothetical protein